MKFSKILENITFNTDGLVPVITQDETSRDVLMMAWMNAESLIETLNSGHMCYFSRSRSTLWRKGESSGQTQLLKELTIDCDGDTLLALVEQKGVACHTGRKTCFFKKIEGETIHISQDIVVQPEELYKN